jgi:NAD-dependent SIR2 family protein deacetylase
MRKMGLYKDEFEYLTDDGVKIFRSARKLKEVKCSKCGKKYQAYIQRPDSLCQSCSKKKWNPYSLNYYHKFWKLGLSKPRVYKS